MARERLEYVWLEMRQRCKNPKHHAYKYYGGRGIKICKEWESYKTFRDWAAMTGYNANAKRGECTLDRIDPNGNYEPLNCRWVSMRVQQNNKRNNHYITINGVTRTIAEWGRTSAINEMTIRKRLEYGWSDVDAVTMPLKRRVKK